MHFTYVFYPENVLSIFRTNKLFILRRHFLIYRVILSVLDPRKCEYIEDYSLDFEHAYMTTDLAS